MNPESLQHDRIPEIALDWHRSGKGAALATVIETWGSAPRQPGSQLAISGEGEIMGSVSGGCVEGAVVVEALLRIGRRSLRNTAMLAIALAAFVGIFFFDVPFPLIVFAAALIGYFGASLRPQLFGGGHAPPAVTPAGRAAISMTPPTMRLLAATLFLGLVLWFGPTLAAMVLVGSASAFADIGVFFSKMAIVTFGGAYAVLTYVAQQAVDTYGWLTAGEMLTGLGLAETTPGPLIMVVQFVAFLGAYRHPGPFDPMTAAILGGLLATWVTFAPCFLWIFLGAPFVERLRHQPQLNAALAAITAAVVGVILNLALWFALHVLFARVDEQWFGPARLFVPDLTSLDPWALLIAAAAAVAMLRLKLGMLATLALSALAGLVLHAVL